MKSLFDFIGRTEVTRGARRCSWTTKSASALVSPDKRLSWVNTSIVNKKTEARRFRFFGLAGLAGFEPTHDGVKVRCLTAWL
jgi:hypothetical protein